MVPSPLQCLSLRISSHNLPSLHKSRILRHWNQCPLSYPKSGYRRGNRSLNPQPKKSNNSVLLLWAGAKRQASRLLLCALALGLPSRPPPLECWLSLLGSRLGLQMACLLLSMRFQPAAQAVFQLLWTPSAVQLTAQLLPRNLPTSLSPLPPPSYLLLSSWCGCPIPGGNW